MTRINFRAKENITKHIEETVKILKEHDIKLSKSRLIRLGTILFCTQVKIYNKNADAKENILKFIEIFT